MYINSLEHPGHLTMAHQGTSSTDRFITDIEAAHLVGVTRSYPWKLAARGEFPKPVKITSGCTRWRLSEIQTWMADPSAWKARQQKGVAA
ncbi:AlpA family transcriptional regulator [Comamonas sp. BIGb0124]|uniref:helix-turn-helix transcriptional regulator n=1 Tax=Comamonas sp. BIGb0124 TaxID=2485130 RepID=UPI000F48CF20|nr:AlpA family phage regulatory protein [Comamonas sp. BIGb0124]ROR21725.1 AlpA family transcriptional regulator [Comamonas sp. BIGb0124]